MNKYLIPVSLEDDIWIESIMARSLEDAKSKIMTRFSEDYDLDYCNSYEEFKKLIKQQKFVVVPIVKDSFK